MLCIFCRLPTFIRVAMLFIIILSSSDSRLRICHRPIHSNDALITNMEPPLRLWMSIMLPHFNATIIREDIQDIHHTSHCLLHFLSNSHKILLFGIDSMTIPHRPSRKSFCQVGGEGYRRSNEASLKMGSPRSMIHSGETHFQRTLSAGDCQLS